MPDTSAPSSTKSLPSPVTIEKIDPSKVRVIDVENKRTGEVVRRDCYARGGGLKGEDLHGVQNVFQLVDGEVHICVIDWARTASMNPTVELRWVPTGIHAEDVDQIRIFTWPDAKLDRVFKHTE